MVSVSSNRIRMMARLQSVLLLSGFLLDFAESQKSCGFPGRPRDGRVSTVKSPFQSLDEFNWKRSGPLTGHVDYHCDSSQLIDSYESNVYVRQCIDGKWTGVIPQCAEAIRVANLQILTFPFDFPCLRADISIMGNAGRRLYAIRWTSDLIVPNFTLFGLLPGGRTRYPLTIVHRKDADSALAHRSFFVLVKRPERFSGILICDSVFLGFVSRLKILTLPDECGHPEIPFNGHVDWESGGTTATYRCDPGFRLIPDSYTRRCVQGQWSGPEPVCIRILNPTTTTSTSSTTTTRTTRQATTQSIRSPVAQTTYYEVTSVSDDEILDEYFTKSSYEQLTETTPSVLSTNVTESPKYVETDERSAVKHWNILVGISCVMGIVILALLLAILWKRIAAEPTNQITEPVYDDVYSPGQSVNSMELGHVYDEIRHQKKAF